MIHGMTAAESVFASGASDARARSRHTLIPLRIRGMLPSRETATGASMTKIECEECGRKITVQRDEHVVQKRFCPRCGTEFPDA